MINAGLQEDFWEKKVDQKLVKVKFSFKLMKLNMSRNHFRKQAVKINASPKTA